MKWNKPSEVLPELIPVDSDTRVAISKPVLCAVWWEEFEEWLYCTGSYRRGGQGDDCTLYWDCDESAGEPPDLWAEFEEPAMPDKPETGDDD